MVVSRPCLGLLSAVLDVTYRFNLSNNVQPFPCYLLSGRHKFYEPNSASFMWHKTYSVSQMPRHLCGLPCRNVHVKVSNKNYDNSSSILANLIAIFKLKDAKATSLVIEPMLERNGAWLKRT